MNKELKQAQRSLTEHVIRRFWQAMTISYPQLCVNNGLSVDYHKHVTVAHIKNMADILTKCMVGNDKSKKKRFVATPLFQYYYDPPNKETPHHVSALTLTCLPGHDILSFFDPKGSGSLRPKEELLMLQILAEAIHQRTGHPVQIQIYTGDNLQKNDNIGLCQLFSLFYLREYVDLVSHATSGHRQKASGPWQLSYHPNQIVRDIKQKYGHYSSSVLHQFWKQYFPHHR
jgi:hypothetical protein